MILIEYSMTTDCRMRCGEVYSAGIRDMQIRAGQKDLHAHGVSDTAVEAVIRHINEMISLTEDGAMMPGNPLARYKLANMLSIEAQIVYDDGSRDVFDQTVCDGQVKIVEGLKKLCVLRASFCRQHKAELKSDSAMRKLRASASIPSRTRCLRTRPSRTRLSARIFGLNGDSPGLTLP